MFSPKKEALKRLPYIHYQVQFKKNMAEVQALIDSKSEVNTIASTYIKILSLQVQKTDVGAQKINKSTLETYDIVIVGFQVQDKFKNTKLFYKTFWVTDISVEVVFKIFFLTLSKIEVNFVEKKLT